MQGLLYVIERLGTVLAQTESALAQCEQAETAGQARISELEIEIESLKKAAAKTAEKAKT